MTRRLPLVASIFAGLVLLPEVAAAHPLVISQVRHRGPNGASDELVEIYNDADEAHVVKSSSGNGYGLAASDGITRFTIPNGTVIPARGHFLGVNSLGYSLASYPASTTSTATGDVTFTTDIPDNAGIALFDNDTGGASYSLAHRFDAVGAQSEENPLYKEGIGYPPLPPFNIDYALVRGIAGAGPIVPAKSCLDSLSGTAPSDTDDNATDFFLVDTNGTKANNQQRLGAPGPRNLSSPIASPTSAAVRFGLLDPTVGLSSPPNSVRDFTSDPANESTFGTVDLRRRFENTTGAPITRLRFRIVAVSTFPAPWGTADLRPRTSTAVHVVRAKAGGGTEIVVVNGTTLEQPPSQPSGGGFNSSLSVSAVSAEKPLAPGASIDVRFLFGVQHKGAYQFFVEAEALPAVNARWGILASTDGEAPFVDCTPASTETTLAASATKALAGDAVTLSATSLAGENAAVGDVAFMDGGRRLGVAKLVDGKAVLTTSSLSAGSHSISAVYLGNGATERSASLPVLVQVDVPAAPSSDTNDTNGGAAGGAAPTTEGAGASSASGDAETPLADAAGGCNAGRRADASSLSFVAVLFAAVLIASRRRRIG